MASESALLKTLLGDIVPEETQELIEVRHDTTIEQVLHIMETHNITSVPVRGPGADQQTPGNPNECLGIINLVDIVHFVVFAICEGDEFLRVDLSNLSRMEIPVQDLVGTFSTESSSDWSFKTYLTTDVLEEAIYPYASGVHRCLVYNPETEKETLLSQTDIIRFFVANKDELAQMTLTRALPLASDGNPDNVLKIKDSDRTLVGYRKMCQYNRSSCAVVDEDGKLVGNLSLSDLRGLTKANFTELANPVSEYLANKGGGAPVSLGAAATAAEVMETMVGGDSSIHRVWVVDDDGVPIGQWSMSDVLLAFSDLSVPLVMPSRISA